MVSLDLLGPNTNETDTQMSWAKLCAVCLIPKMDYMIGFVLKCRYILTLT